MARAKKQIADGAPKPKRGRPKKIVETVESVPTSLESDDAHSIVGPEIREGFVHLSRTDLLEFELKQAKLAALQSRQRLLRYEYTEIRRQQDKELLTVEANFRHASEEYLSYKNKLGRRYEVDFNVATYDDSTGRLLIEGAPLLAPD